MRANEFIIEKKKRRKNKYGLAAWGPGPYGWYGYDAGYSGSSSDGGGDGGGGESIEYNTSEDQDLSIDVANAISRLPDGRLKDVIEMRFKYDMTYDAIGKELGVGTERARQIVAKAIRHLRHPKYGLTDGIEEDWKTALAGAALSTGIAMGGSADAKVNVGIDNQGYSEPIQLIQQVKKGDTVYSIARNYGVSPDDIRRVNDLDKNYTISPGQELAIPKKTAGKKTTTASTPTKIAINKTLTGTTHEAILTAEARKAGITDPIELAAFLAQCAHESHDFKSMIEYGGTGYFKQYEPKFLKDKKTGKVIVDPKTKKYKNFNDKAVDLGNDYRGDGVRYKGRGYIQLTGRDNYKRVGKALGLDLVNNPELAEKPEIAAKVAVLYWKQRTQPRVDDFNDVRAVTKTINPGLNGLKDRKETFADFKKFKMASIK